MNELKQQAYEIVEQELIRIRQSPQQVAPSFDDVHEIVNKVLDLVADCVCIPRKQLQEMINKIPIGDRKLRFTAGYIHALEKLLGTRSYNGIDEKEVVRRANKIRDLMKYP